MRLPWPQSCHASVLAGALDDVLPGCPLVVELVPFDPLVLGLELVLPVPVVAGDVPATSTVPLDPVHAATTSATTTTGDQRGARTTADATGGRRDERRRQVVNLSANP